MGGPAYIPKTNHLLPNTKKIDISAYKLYLIRVIPSYLNLR